MLDNALRRLREGPANKSILLIGDLMLDRYITGTVSRISPEAPVPILDVLSEEYRLGGAANVAHNLRVLGATVRVLGMVGDDVNGQLLRDTLAKQGIDAGIVVVDNSRPTTVKTRLIAQNHQMLRYDIELRKWADPEIQERLLERVEDSLAQVDIIVMSDYGKGVLGPEVAQGVIHLARSTGKRVVVDPKGSDYRKYSGSYMVTPNIHEAEKATGYEIADAAALRNALVHLRDVTMVDVPLITMGAEGMAYLLEDRVFRIPATAREVFDVTGAGDTAVGVLAYAMNCGLPIDSSIFLANVAAGIVVGKVGTATVSIAEIIKQVDGTEPFDSYQPWGRT